MIKKLSSSFIVGIRQNYLRSFVLLTALQLVGAEQAAAQFAVSVPSAGSTIELNEDFLLTSQLSPSWYSSDLVTGPRWDATSGAWVSTTDMFPAAFVQQFSQTYLESYQIPRPNWYGTFWTYYPLLLAGYGGKPNPFGPTTSGTNYLQVGFRFQYGVGGGVGFDALFDTNPTWVPSVGSTKSLLNNPANPDCFSLLADQTGDSFTVRAGNQSYDLYDDGGSTGHVVTFSFSPALGQYSYNVWIDGTQVINGALYEFAPNTMWFGGISDWFATDAHTGTCLDTLVADYVRTWWSPLG